MSDHLAKAFEEELIRLKSMVTDMGNLTVDQLDTVLKAAEQHDSDLASRVIQREPDADRLEHQIDNLVVFLVYPPPILDCSDP